MIIPTYPFVTTFGKYPKIAGLMGLLFAMLFLYAGIESWKEVQRYKEQQPQTITASEAIKKLQEGNELRVELTDVKADCGKSYRDKDNALTVPIYESSGNYLIVGDFSTNVECGEVSSRQQIDGVLSKLNSRRYQSLAFEHFYFGKYTDPNKIYTLCNFCGPANSQGALVIFSILFIASLSLYPLSLWLQKSMTKKK